MDSKLQIISGEFRGRKLIVPDGIARPTQNRARIALFNMLGGIIDGTTDMIVWDAFAGSGAFGLECISRFPNARAIFTDNDDVSIRAIRRNVGDWAADRATIDKTDAMRAIGKYGAASDIIFVDPPYAMADFGVQFIKKLMESVRTGTLVIWEQDARNATIPDASWNILRDKQYGRARFFIMQRE